MFTIRKYYNSQLQNPIIKTDNVSLNFKYYSQKFVLSLI